SDGMSHGITCQREPQPEKAAEGADHRAVVTVPWVDLSLSGSFLMCLYPGIYLGRDMRNQVRDAPAFQHEERREAPAYPCDAVRDTSLVWSDAMRGALALSRVPVYPTLTRKMSYKSQIKSMNEQEKH
ncbi:hypothetical protein HAX54_047139, partial [Datura stramonium]|nr:hypothetical protein [Datura stramonium]